MTCLLCDSLIKEAGTWKGLFFLEEQPFACEDCRGGFERIIGKICICCGRSMPEERLCGDCRQWEKTQGWKGLLKKNRSIYSYNEFMKDTIARFKYRGDAELVKLFSSDLKKAFKKHFTETDLIVPIPLSLERLSERGFNQAELLAKQLSLTIIHPLTRTSTEKQSKKTRKERLRSQQPFQLTPTVEIHQKNILLVDDIYTTGKTLRQAAKLLLENGALTVSSLTLVRG
ncbi:ComF family protein [Metabacillus sp. RGM 3146]|uniref:ComF family protein n=1 Tax=Metabacillus sp. RGM 3146 TaxID=3401092 RepID=UPI003B9D65B0